MSGRFTGRSLSFLLPLWIVATGLQAQGDPLREFLGSLTQLVHDGQRQAIADREETVLLIMEPVISLRRADGTPIRHIEPSRGIVISSKIDRIVFQPDASCRIEVGRDVSSADFANDPELAEIILQQGEQICYLDFVTTTGRLQHAFSGSDATEQHELTDEERERREREEYLNRLRRAAERGWAWKRMYEQIVETLAGKEHLSDEEAARLEEARAALMEINREIDETREELASIEREIGALEGKDSLAAGEERILASLHECREGVQARLGIPPDEAPEPTENFTGDAEALVRHTVELMRENDRNRLGYLAGNREAWLAYARTVMPDEARRAAWEARIATPEMISMKQQALRREWAEARERAAEDGMRWGEARFLRIQKNLAVYKHGAMEYEIDFYVTDGQGEEAYLFEVDDSFNTSTGWIVAELRYKRKEKPE